MGSGVKVWTINSLADEIIRGILKGSVVDVVSKERISKRFGAISRVIVAHKKTLRISESQASMFGFGEIFRKMENLRKILFCGPEEGCEPVNLGRQLAHLNPNIVSIRDVNSSESLVRHSRDTVPIVMEYVLASYNNDKSYTGSNLEIEFPQSMADLLTRQCPGLNLKTDVWWSEAAADEMATCRWLHLEGPDGGVVENGTYPSVKIISIDGTFSHLESLRSFPNLEVLCLYGHGDGLVDLHQFLPSTIKKLELFFEEISDRHVSLLNSLLDNFNLTSVYLHVVNSCNNEKQEFQKILYTLIRTRNQSPRTFAIKRVFKMSGRNMRIKISPATSSLLKLGIELVPWIGLIPLLLNRFKHVKDLEIVFPERNFEDQDTEGCVVFFYMLRKLAKRDRRQSIKVTRKITGAYQNEVFRL